MALPNTMRLWQLFWAVCMFAGGVRAQDLVFEFIFTTDGRSANAPDPMLPYRIVVGPAFLDEFLEAYRNGRIKVFDDFECKSSLDFPVFAQYSHIKEYLENREKILAHGFSLWLHQRWEYERDRWLTVSLTAGLRWDDPVGVLPSKTVFFRYTDAQDLFDKLELRRSYNGFLEENPGAALTRLRFNFDLIAFRSSSEPKWRFHPEYNYDYGFPVQGVKSRFRDSVMALVANPPVFVAAERYPVRTYSPFVVALPAPIMSKNPERGLCFDPDQTPFCDWAFTQNFIFYESVVRQIPYLLAARQIRAYHPDTPQTALNPERLLNFLSLLVGEKREPTTKWADFEPEDDQGDEEMPEADEPAPPPQDFAAFPRLLRPDNTFCMVRGTMTLHAGGAEFKPLRLILVYKDPANLVSDRPLAEFDLDDLQRLSTGKILDRTLSEFLASLDYLYHPVQINDYRPASVQEAAALAYAYESPERDQLLEVKDLVERITPNVVRARRLEKGACSSADSAFRALILLGVADLKTAVNTENLTIHPYTVRMFHAAVPDSVAKLSESEKAGLKTLAKDLERLYQKATGKDRPPFATVEVRVEGTFQYRPDTIVYAPTMLRFWHGGREYGTFSLTSGDAKLNGAPAAEFAAGLLYPHRLVKAGKWSPPDLQSAEILKLAFEERRSELLQSLEPYWKRHVVSSAP
ncbi:MAG: hypothetical protein RMM53_00475 [Bacteroidia bacterium]|nr:hypothetical protein [Bacteroidia bacterium]MDW8332669.1 hypothetical protein [Bacteroidia bacterium]